MDDVGDDVDEDCKELPMALGWNPSIDASNKGIVLEYFGQFTSLSCVEDCTEAFCSKPYSVVGFINLSKGTIASELVLVDTVNDSVFSLTCDPVICKFTLISLQQYISFLHLMNWNSDFFFH